jgi:DNA-binding transcriptional regulator YiaG
VSIALAKDLQKKVTVPDKAVEDFDRKFGARMKNVREERGLKRDWVAIRLEVHYNTLKNWELGKSHPGTREILALCKIYHCKPGELFRGLSA